MSGDREFVCRYPNGVLIAAIDGIGHGEEAAIAANTAISVLKTNANRPVISLVQECHEALPRTRGVVMSIAS